MLKKASQPLNPIAHHEKNPYLCRCKSGFAVAPARMAESVDAPVSNTGGAIHPGSIPGPGTEKEILTLRVSFFVISQKNLLQNLVYNINRISFAIGKER